MLTRGNLKGRGRDTAFEIVAKFQPLERLQFRLGELIMFNTNIGTRSNFEEIGADDLSREVYCILGMPIDAIDMVNVLRRIDRAAETGTKLFLSTPNLNYLAHCHLDAEFREALILSDLSPADGMSIVWLARLLGAPIRERVAGSDVFAALKHMRPPDRPLKVFLFGGDEGVAAAASDALNDARSGVVCVGWHFPGFLSVEELSESSLINMINSAGADFLVVCLGAKKGQLWLKRNSTYLRSSIRSHLGASLNFEAEKIRRAPVFVRKLGLEWVWRIKEEPYLWRRYWRDGLLLINLLYSRVLPLWLYRLRTNLLSDRSFSSYSEVRDDCYTVGFVGPATRANIDEIIRALRTARLGGRVIIDMTAVSAIDTRFLGVLLVFYKMLRARNAELVLKGVSSELQRIIDLNGADIVLVPQNELSNLANELPNLAVVPAFGEKHSRGGVCQSAKADWA